MAIFFSLPHEQSIEDSQRESRTATSSNNNGIHPQVLPTTSIPHIYVVDPDSDVDMLLSPTMLNTPATPSAPSPSGKATGTPPRPFGSDFNDISAHPVDWSTTREASTLMFPDSPNTASNSFGRSRGSQNVVGPARRKTSRKLHSVYVVPAREDRRSMRREREQGTSCRRASQSVAFEIPTEDRTAWTPKTARQLAVRTRAPTPGPVDDTPPPPSPAPCTPPLLPLPDSTSTTPSPPPATRSGLKIRIPGMRSISFLTLKLGNYSLDSESVGPERPAFKSKHARTDVYSRPADGKPRSGKMSQRDKVVQAREERKSRDQRV